MENFTSCAVHGNAFSLIRINALLCFYAFQFPAPNTAQLMKFCIRGFFNKCDQNPKKPRIWSHLLKKALMGNFIFCALKWCKSLETIERTENNGTELVKILVSRYIWIVVIVFDILTKLAVAVIFNLVRNVEAFKTRPKVLFHKVQEIFHDLYKFFLAMTNYLVDEILTYFKRRKSILS